MIFKEVSQISSTSFQIQCRQFSLYLPEQLAQHGGGELRVLPAAEAQQLHRLLRVAAVLDDLLHVAGSHEEDLGNQLLHRHHRRSQVGVAVRVRQRRVAWVGSGRGTWSKTVEKLVLLIHMRLDFDLDALSSDVRIPQNIRAAALFSH